MAKIAIEDLSKDMTVSRKEMEQVLGGNGNPIPPIPTFGVSIALQRAGLVAIDEAPPGPIKVDNPDPGPIF